MNYFFLVIAVFVSIHAYTFACWLRQKGNTLGTVGVFILIAVSLALPIYRIMSAG